MTSGAYVLVLWFSHISHTVKMHYLLLYHIHHIDSVVLRGCFPMPLLNFIYSMIGLLICKYEPFWHEVSVEFLIFRWPLRHGRLLFLFETAAQVSNVAHVHLVCVFCLRNMLIAVTCKLKWNFVNSKQGKDNYF